MEQTLSRIRAGQRKAFEALVNETWDDLAEYVSSILASREAAEDVCQDAFIRVWEFRDRWHDGSARALVFRIGRNLAFDLRRRERVRRTWVAQQRPTEHCTVPTDELAESSYLELRFREALSALTPGRRQAVESVRLRGLTHQEAAEALGISRQTVANRMTLALADLRILLADVLPNCARARHVSGRHVAVGSS